MRPVPIPDEVVAAFQKDDPSARRIVVGPPEGSDPTGDIRAVEAMYDASSHGPRFYCLLMLEPGDLEKLAENPYLWMVQWAGQMVAWDVQLDADLIS